MGSEVKPQEPTKEQRREVLKVATVTLYSIFIMGYVNAFGMGTGNWLLGAMATPQTGNIVWMGKNLADGFAGNAWAWGALLLNFALFFGFAAGNIFGFYTKSITPDKRKQFYFSWTCFIIPFLLFPVMMQFEAIPRGIAFFTVGFGAGTGLSFFRQLYHLDINNAMATGSARFVGLWFWEACVRKAKTEKKEAFTFVLFAMCLIVFAFGAFLYTITQRFTAGMTVVWTFYIVEMVLAVICLIPYLLLAPKDPDFVKPRGVYGGGINYTR